MASMFRAALAVLLLAGLHHPRTASALECNVCHSKNPAMVKMHTATKEKGISCFDCHKFGEKLMGKGQPKDKESQLRRRGSDPQCKGCHQ